MIEFIIGLVAGAIIALVISSIIYADSMKKQSVETDVFFKKVSDDYKKMILDQQTQMMEIITNLMKENEYLRKQTFGSFIPFDESGDRDEHLFDGF